MLSAQSDTNAVTPSATHISGIIDQAQGYIETVNEVLEELLGKLSGPSPAPGKPIESAKVLTLTESAMQLRSAVINAQASTMRLRAIIFGE